MTARRTQSILGAIGAAVSAAVLGLVAWARVRRVEVPRPSRWDRTFLLVSSDPDLRESTIAAVSLWVALGHRLVYVAEGPADIAVVEDPSLGGESLDGRPVLRGSTRKAIQGTRILDARCRVEPSAPVVVVAHEVGHALGFEHVSVSGHLMAIRNPSTRDLRGLEGP